MNVHSYLERRREREANAPKTRELCLQCLQPSFGCYCNHVRPFDPRIKFMILIHPIEVKRRIATGRMSHLCLEGSTLVRGEDYSQSREVNDVLEDPNFHSVMLYPGRDAVDLTAIAPETRSLLLPSEKKLAVFVIDGTWATARKMVRSENLARLPRICFTPSRPSRFRVRKQPMEGCFSTIEAIHQTIELLGHAVDFPIESRLQDRLLDVFDVMVERQLKCIRELRTNRHANYRRESRD